MDRAPRAANTSARAAGEGQDNAHVEHSAEQLVPTPRGIYSLDSRASAFKAPPPVPTPMAGLLVVEGSSSVVVGGVVIVGTCKDQIKASVHTAEQPSTSTPITCHLFSSPLEEMLAAALDSSVTPQQATEPILPIRASLENQSQTHAPPQIPISWPSDSILTFNWIMSLMDASEWGSQRPPSEFSSICPAIMLDSIILSASTILRKKPNCVHIDGLDDDSSVVVVGDVHVISVVKKDSASWSKKIRLCNCPWTSPTTTTLESSPSPSM
ncbi:hypothetical protein Vadar_032700 [Vaccinium darrowii]|uniref:Uncharacterized protein n=1 Tax=Vaccinium darrowii TaxID=229202 RepID=A0ACB7YZV9_9ERIC|nr:hypothetical protein Vadar_032700 [Vaccinium darrowii]